MAQDAGGQPDAAQLLSEANLHRLRGEWPQAEAKCRQALALDPTDPAAHALLGDISAVQQRTDEAIRSYRAALELSDDYVVRLKLDGLLERRRKTAMRPVSPAPRARERRAGLFDSPRARTTAAAIFVGVAVIFAVVVIATQLRSRGRAVPVTTETRRTAAAAPPAELVEPGGAIAAPASASAHGAAAWGRPAATPAPRGARPLVQPSHLPRGAVRRDRNVISIARITAPLTDREKRLVYELSQLRLSDRNPIGTPFVNATIDPASEHLMITFEVPVEVAHRPSKDFIRMEAQRLLIRASQVDERFRTASVRVIVGWTDPRSGARHKDVAFRADTTRERIETVGLIRSDERSGGILRKMWWNPVVGKALPSKPTSR